MEQTYVASDGNRVKWWFHGIEEIFLIEGEVISNSTELFSRFLSPEKAKVFFTSGDI